MPLIFDVDGRPAFIPSQSRRRQQSAAVRRPGKLVRDPLLGRFWEYPDGRRVELTQQRAAEKGTKVYLFPGTQEVMAVHRYSSRRRRRRRIFGKILLNPYVMGALTGFGLPALLTEAQVVLVGSGIATAGFFSPRGSYMKKFTYGAAVGAGAKAGLKHKDIIKRALEIAADVADVALAIPGAIGDVVQKIQPVTDVLEALTPGEDKHFDAAKLRDDAQKKLKKKYGNSVWRRLMDDPVDE